MAVRRSGLARIAAHLVAATVVVSACSPQDTEIERSADPTEAAATTGGRTESGSGTVSPTAAELDPGSTVRIGLSGVLSLDPAIASPANAGDMIVADLLYDTLTVIDDEGVVGPGLASFSSNDELTVWRFELDRGATFADGTPVGADDVVFSLERVLAEGRASLAALRLDQVESLSTEGAQTVTVSLTAPSAVFPEVVSSPMFAITDRAAMTRMLTGGDATPNSSGSFVAGLDGADRVVLRRRSGEGPAGVVVDLFDDESRAVDAFVAGELDWTTVPPDRLTEVLRITGGDGLVPFHGGLFLGVDQSVSPLDQANLRRAIALAIDRQSLVDAVFGPTAQPAAGIIPAGVVGGGGACRGVCGPDPAVAADLAAEALPDGQERPLRLVVDNTESQRAVGGVIEDQLGAVGIDVTVESLPVPTYEELIASGQPQLFVYGWLGVARSPSDHLPLFDSASPDNLSGFRNEAIDAAIRLTMVEPDPAVRLESWMDIERRILERVPVVPLVQFRTTGVTGPRLEGLVVRPDGTLDLSAVTLNGR